MSLSFSAWVEIKIVNFRFRNVDQALVAKHHLRARNTTLVFKLYSHNPWRAFHQIKQLKIHFGLRFQTRKSRKKGINFICLYFVESKTRYKLAFSPKFFEEWPSSQRIPFFRFNTGPEPSFKTETLSSTMFIFSVVTFTLPKLDKTRYNILTLRRHLLHDFTLILDS